MIDGKMEFHFVHIILHYFSLKEQGMNITEDKIIMIANGVRTRDLADYIGCKKSLHKEDMISLLRQKLRKKTDIEAFCDRFPKETALRSDEVVRVLGCTKPEVSRWTQEGKLSVVYKKEFRMYGKTLEVNMYDSKQVLFGITDKKIEKWRNDHNKETEKNRNQGAVKAKTTKAIHAKIKAQERIKLDNAQKEWEQIGKEARHIMTLAYWTMWINRWAKKHQIAKDDVRKNFFYRKKESALRYLWGSKYAEVSFYRPEHPDKTIREYRDDDYEEDFDYDDFYFLDDEKDREYEEVVLEKDYYSLYYIKLSCPEKPTYKFSFHIPYSIGKDFLPDPESLPMVIHRENEGMFRFGRPVSKYEMISHTEKNVLKNFDAELENVMKLYGS